MTLIERIKDHAEKQPDKSALIIMNESVTYAALWRHIKSAAYELQERHIEKGDMVILSATVSPSFVYGYFAAHLIGAIAVPVDPQSPIDRLNYINNAVRAKAIFNVPAQKTTLDNSYNINELASIGRGVDSLSFPDETTVADILFTTGTTGDPKGVVLTHRNIVAAALNINTFIKNTKNDTEVVPLPLSHSFGLGRLRCNMLSGGTLVLVDGYLFAGGIFKAFEVHKATGFASVPSGLALLLRLTGDKIGEFTHQLKYIEIGSAPMPLEYKERLAALLPNTRICMHYGLTEASRSTFIEFHDKKEKVSASIGRPTPNVEVRIVDAEHRQVKPNTLGHIAIKGEMVMKEYWNDADRSRQVLAEGWFYTDDMGTCDNDGYVYLAARDKEMINVGGRKVSPIEIEKILDQHEGVVRSACIGIPDPRGIMGEVVKAYVVRKDKVGPLTDEILFTYCEDKLETYKMPAVIEWIDELPMTSSGKLQRLKLKKSSEARS